MSRRPRSVRVALPVSAVWAALVVAAAAPAEMRPDLRRQALLFTVAVQFLTRLPTPRLPGYRSEWLSSSARYFPLVGVLVGVANALVWWLAARVLPATVSVGLMLAVSLLLTGAFHEDGFADACDGFGGGHTPERVLDIMKDSRIGAYGAIGIFMMLGLKWATVEALPAAYLPLMLVSAHMVSRWCATGLIWSLSYVRAGNDAKSKPMAQGFTAGGWLLSGVLGALGVMGAAAALQVLSPRDSSTIGPIITAWCAALLTAAVVTVTAAIYVRQRIGGYTGDCLGAVQQLTELGFLLSGLSLLVRV